MLPTCSSSSACLVLFFNMAWSHHAICRHISHHTTFIYFIILLSDSGIYKYLIWQESSHLILFGLPVSYLWDLVISDEPPVLSRQCPYSADTTDSSTLPLHCTYPIADYAYTAHNNDKGESSVMCVDRNSRHRCAHTFWFFFVLTTGSKQGGYIPPLPLHMPYSQKPLLTTWCTSVAWYVSGEGIGVRGLSGSLCSLNLRLVASALSRASVVLPVHFWHRCC